MVIDLTLITAAVVLKTVGGARVRGPARRDRAGSRLTPALGDRGGDRCVPSKDQAPRCRNAIAGSVINRVQGCV